MQSLAYPSSLYYPGTGDAVQLSLAFPSDPSIGSLSLSYGERITIKAKPFEGEHGTFQYWSGPLAVVQLDDDPLGTTRNFRRSVCASRLSQ